MRIGELARRTGASARSLRYYEQRGLLEGRRGAGGHRTYGEAEVAQVRFVRGLLSAGLSTHVIGELLQRCDQRTIEGASHTATTLREERDRLDSCIEKLLDARGRLDEFIAEVEARDLDRGSSASVDRA